MCLTPLAPSCSLLSTRAGRFQVQIPGLRLVACAGRHFDTFVIVILEPAPLGPKIVRLGRAWHDLVVRYTGRGNGERRRVAAQLALACDFSYAGSNHLGKKEEKRGR